jgi:hypothetical protein
LYQLPTLANVCSIFSFAHRDSSVLDTLSIKALRAGLCRNRKRWKINYYRKIIILINNYSSFLLHGVHPTWMGFELTTLVVIDTDCICSRKSNYHTITTVDSKHIINIIENTNVDKIYHILLYRVHLVVSGTQTRL